MRGSASDPARWIWVRCSLVRIPKWRRCLPVVGHPMGSPTIAAREVSHRYLSPHRCKNTLFSQNIDRGRLVLPISSSHNNDGICGQHVWSPVTPRNEVVLCKTRMYHWTVKHRTIASQSVAVNSSSLRAMYVQIRVISDEIYVSNPGISRGWMKVYVIIRGNF
jgi:hypothetical protein